MNGKRQNYVYGTAVKKLEPAVHEQSKTSKNKSKVNDKNKRKILCHVMFCCALALIMMYRYCLLTELSYGVSKKYNEYEKLRNMNISLKVEIEKEQNLLKIKEIAYNKLNMRTAQKEQVVYVKVPTTDFTKYASNKESKGIISVVLKKLEELKSYF